MHTLLIVDDDPAIRIWLQELVIHMGHHAILAPEGNGAWQILTHNAHIDLLITDMQMPRCNGDQLITRLKNHPQLKPLPVIMVSGFVTAHEVRRLMNHCIDRFVPKPINPKQITTYIQDMLEQSDHRPPVKTSHPDISTSYSADPSYSSDLSYSSDHIPTRLIA